MKLLRFTTPQLLKGFGFGSAAALTAALFLAVGLLICAVVNSVMLRQFPLPTPDQLDSMFDTKPKSFLDLRYTICNWLASAPNYCCCSNLPSKAPEGISGGPAPHQNSKSQI